MLKKILLFLITLALVLSLAACKDNNTDDPDVGDEGGGTTPTEEEDKVLYSGELEGTALTWEIDRHGTLTVKGSGAMPDFDTPNEQPWYAHGSERMEDRTDAEGGLIRVTKVVIGQGVSAIGENNFSDFETLTQVTLATSVKTVAFIAFKNCPKLQLVQGGFGLETIETSAFKDCPKLETIQLSSALTTVQTSAFQGCGGDDGKMDVTFKGDETEWQAILSLCDSANDPLTTAVVTYV